MPPRCTFNGTPPPLVDARNEVHLVLPRVPISDHGVGVVLEFDMGGSGSKKPPPKPGAGKQDRPWRKSAAAIKEEKAKSAAILGAAGGVNQGALRMAIAAQELLDGGCLTDASQAAAAQAATTTMLQVATNARPAAEVDAARAALDGAFRAAGQADALARLDSSDDADGRNKLQLLHEVMPRLWVGGWAALNNECEALRSRKVTHVLSVHSADQGRRLPSFIQSHLYKRVDDTEEAAEVLASHFEEMTQFIEQARSGGGVVFVHCGAGISRAPSTAVAYLVWKFRMRAVDAIALVRAKRHNVRPNPGFVRQLKLWEHKVLATTPVEAGAVAQGAPPNES
jgi:protein-tyrosine phosphatase